MMVLYKDEGDGVVIAGVAVEDHRSQARIQGMDALEVACSFF